MDDYTVATAAWDAEPPFGPDLPISITRYDLFYWLAHSALDSYSPHCQRRAFRQAN
ncbi:hypothetical protein PGT21_013966 [Puccinia graminis f. sp. tritici]|uniref:Uncharacterized protein n=1 Tax=Puccinia graminis f. sp. tritici TaxID=56615 RepID=A0A5B0LRX1_PUCGR|nr:hypothetical protein PGTUg99_002524 [Puccinia graminis f. sp. tritici]KAA1084002.1 hypothetical protein PGT21_013966 [Puccinia graminis f. sp. tritici]